MTKAILIHVSKSGLEALEDWDMDTIKILAQMYDADIVRPLYLCSFDYDKTFKVWATCSGMLKIAEMQKDEQNADKNE